MKSDPILAAAFSHADGNDQGGLLNSFARELFIACRGSNAISGFEMQCCSIERALDKDGRSFIKQLAGFIELREREMPQ